MIKDILDGTYDDDLDAIIDAVKMRRKRKARQISVGTKVRVIDISPKYLIGATGTITKRNRTTFGMKFDDDVDTGRFSQEVRIPMVAVEPVLKDPGNLEVEPA